MRIIAGEAKGRKLTAPDNQHVRPTGDRVKESIFNMISTYVYGAVVVDVFAGTGNLGLEAISRGAEKVFFIDNSLTSLEIIKKNIELTGFSRQSSIIHSHYKKGLMGLPQKADIFFLDPPYNKGYIMNCIRTISFYEKISEKGILVIEHNNEEVPDNIEEFRLIKRKRYGITTISILSYSQ